MDEQIVATAGIKQSAPTIEATCTVWREAKAFGRPEGSTKITEELTEGICEMLEKAVPMHYAAEANGIHRNTLRNWMDRGERGEEPFAAFFVRATRARARAVPNMHDRALAGEKGGSAAMWLLSKSFKDDYGSQQRVEHVSADGKDARSYTELLADHARFVEEMREADDNEFADDPDMREIERPECST